LSWDEFADLTPSMFNALCARRNIHFKHDRFANALTAAAVYNVNRASADAPVISAFDFIRDEKDSEAKAETQKIKAVIQQVVGLLPHDTPKEKLHEVRRKTIASLKAQGRQDAEQLFDSCWPSLRPKE
jgi:hypothetical protein